MTVVIVIVALVVVAAALFFLIGPPRRRRKGVPLPDSGRAVAEAREALAEPGREAWPTEPIMPAPPEAPPLTRVPGLGGRIRALFSGGAPTDDTWKGLEDVLVRADVGPTAALRIVH